MTPGGSRGVTWQDGCHGVSRACRGTVGRHLAGRLPWRGTSLSWTVTDHGPRVAPVGSPTLQLN